MMGRRRKWLAWGAAGALVAMLAAGLLLIRLERAQGRIQGTWVEFKESDKALDNPDQGFYSIYRFMLSDEDGDFSQNFQEMDQCGRLVLVEINLTAYRDRPISQTGLAQVREIFQRLEREGKRLIVRFLYDWQGACMETEPEDMGIILGHMEQLGPMLLAHSQDIFTLQGVFTGNWGEGNGTRYDSQGSVRILAEKLAQVTENRLYMAVRTPCQWRWASGEGRFIPEEPWNRLGLFNDGMLGNESDFGTYSLEASPDPSPGIYDPWSREAELGFQEELCRWVPNGGEAINSNYYNDFENAVEGLRTMRVTYLNQDHDPAVLRKWAKATWQEGVFKGMDGLSYIQRHLGYRLLIQKARLVPEESGPVLGIEMKNVGFAPLYWEPDKEVVLIDGGGREAFRCLADGELRELAGGNEDQRTLMLRARIDWKALPPGEYTVYFSLTGPLEGAQLELAVQQDAGELGYQLGRILVGE